MKLIFVNRYYDPDISATSRILTDVARDQAGRGRDVHVVTSRQRYDDAAIRLPREETIAGVRVHRVATTRFGRHRLAGRGIDYLTFHLSAARCLLRLSAPGDIVVAKTDPPLISVVAAWVARRRGALLVNWLQDVFPEVGEQLGVRMLGGSLGSLARRLRDYSLRNARVNVVVGHRMRDRISASGELRVTVIPNWADGSAIRPIAHEDNPLRAEWGLDGKFVVGYSGNMGRAHEFGTILDACEALREERDLVFLFIGAGKQRDWIAAEAQRRGVLNIRFEPYQDPDRLAFSLSVADVHLVSLQPQLEGLIVPSKFYGIAAAGRPTIFVGDSKGEIARILEEDGSGVSVESGDAKALAAAILAFRNDGDRWSLVAAKARQRFEEVHDRRFGLERWDQVFSSPASRAA